MSSGPSRVFLYMETVQSRDGTPIAFERVGAGPSLILVTGALADRSTAARVAESLAPHFTVFTYDRRGRGASGDAATYAVDREIDDIEALLAAADGPSVVFGHSSGAVLALLAAARALPIARVAAYEPPLALPGDRDIPGPDLADRVRGLVEAGHRDEAVRLFLTEAVQMPPEMITMIARSPGWPAIQALAHTVPYDIAICGTDLAVPTDRLAHVAVPALVMDGGDSPTWIRNGARAVADATPGSTHRTLEGQQHGPADDVLVPVLVDFLT